MFQLFGEVFGTFTDYWAMQNKQNAQSLAGQKEATIQNYEDWKAAKERAEADYNIKGLQQSITVIILVLFAAFLLYLIFRKK